MNYSGFFRAVETYHFPSNCEALGLDPFTIGKGSYKSTNGRFFHCSLVVYPLDTGWKKIHPKVGGGGGAKPEKKKPFIRLDTEIVEISVNFKKNKNQIFWICRILGRATTRMTWSNLKLDDENKFPGIVRIPQSGRSLYCLLGWREPRSSDGGCWGFWVASFFSKMCFFGKDVFFLIIQSDQNRGNLDNQKLDPQFLHMVLQASTDGTDVSFWHGSINIKTRRDRTVSYSPMSCGLKNREALNISVTNQQHWVVTKTVRSPCRFILWWFMDLGAVVSHPPPKECLGVLVSIIFYRLPNLGFHDPSWQTRIFL